MSRKFAYLLWIVPLVGMTIGNPIEIQEPDTILANDLEEAGGHFEGDMILDDHQKDVLQTGRTALIGPSYRWPDYTVYYTIEPNDFSAVQKNSIKQALQEIMMVSCVKFVERTTQKDYVRVTGANSGCWSYLGHIGGAQQLNLQPNGCMSRGTIMHEFLHSLGFVHMQSASDRDFYVRINWATIQSGKSSNFDRYNSKVINDYGIPYDYNSVMHYPATAFSTNGQATIIPFESGVSIGQRVGMSYKDIKRLNSMYPDCH